MGLGLLRLVGGGIREILHFELYLHGLPDKAEEDVGEEGIEAAEIIVEN
jgi:hypothetical protein